ncbi:MAG: hypothetical protein J1F22_08485 [Lachnospiraceae bacterium]|nr:hypothetical protein [Lachnospiraceae bacterium]
MKKCSKWLLTAVFALCLGLLPQVQSEAAQVTGVKQTGASENQIKVQVDSMAATQAGRVCYFLELSDNPNSNSWTIKNVSTNPNSITVSGLTAGKSYYARVGICTDYASSSIGYTLTGRVAGSESTPIEVVTSPYGTVSATQSNATTSSITIKAATVPGANYYRVYWNDKTLIGQNSSNTVTATNLSKGTSYFCYLYACRKSASGFVAEGSRSYGTCKTLAPAISNNSFGVQYAWSTINSYKFYISSAYARDGLHFQFLTPKGKVKKNVYKDSTDSAYVDNFINGGFYKYRVRTYVKCGTARVYSKWSGYKYIATTKKISGKLVKKSKTVKVSWAKVTNASKYDVSISTKENSGFKKVSTVSAKKRSVVIKKCGKKKLKKNVKYWVRIVPKAKVGKKTVKGTNYMTYYFTIY